MDLEAGQSSETQMRFSLPELETMTLLARTNGALDFDKSNTQGAVALTSSATLGYP